ncbi:L-seryl-tRNA(Sec) selenium transferase [Candidatus Laterigemmans baculatus]|uniref:L-seryl-tRNA(Sec) selenium transferase n=1 Tax=Candidatus Laterigemmans baculatus TaxID=2770505 RepID=UPI00193BA8CD|nr:L-seryl-tRNA(Sec) selenium transferase [Candidatus Laterigemmans baculatus]
MNEPHAVVRRLPSVSRAIDSEAFAPLVDRYGRPAVIDELRKVLAEHRERLLTASHSLDSRPGPAANGNAPAASVRELGLGALSEQVQQRLDRRRRSRSLRPVINGTGILLHTGLGRAPLAREAIDAIAAVAAGYASVELDLESGQRGRRARAVDELLCELTGAEAAVVVNNNAAATVLSLAALAAGREVIVSRGELIEIGGQFRLPEIMAASGAVLREVGSTNKTRIDDYAQAIGEATGALLLVHPSNYVVVGFTEHVSLDELVRLGRSRGVPVIHDIGSGALVDFAQFGFRDEPLAERSIAAGADVVLFSGDKLLGGPQAGIILGGRAAIERIERHPLARAMRVDKLTLAALAATLELYRDPQRTSGTVPLLRLLATPAAELRTRAERLVAALTALPAFAESFAEPEVLPGHGYLGGGAVPTQQQASWCVALSPRSIGLDEFARRLRAARPAIVGRVHDQRWWLDLRTVFPEQDAEVVGVLSAATR